jgi:hypothetical protein
MPTHIKPRQIEELANLAMSQAALGIVELEFLKYFAESQSLSTYDIYALRKRSNPMIYKNVHSRVTRLYELRFIEKIEKESLRGAKYYKLSTFGIFYLIYSNNTFNNTLLLTKNILLNHGDNYLFKEFFDLIVDIHTVLKSSPIFVLCVRDYLHDCCQEILTVVESHKEGHFVSTPIFVWQKVPGEDTTPLKRFLKERFDLNLVNKNLGIKKINDGYTIEISDGTNTVHIDLNGDKSRTAIKINGKQKCELFVRHMIVGDPIDYVCIEVSLLDSFKNALKSCAAKWIFRLTMIASTLPRHDIDLLSQDKKIVRLLGLTLGNFMIGIDKLMSFSTDTSLVADFLKIKRERYSSEICGL